MRWPIIRRFLVAAGVIYAWALIPVQIRPSLPSSARLKKNQQTITVSLADPRLRVSTETLKNACEPPLFLQPFENSAATVRVLFKYQEQIIGVKTYDCPAT
jgi:hypothetical protein